jgi:succinate-semialdehyde dehydrogenase/glutarate-semialdehyde dehydrogenase
MIYQTVNPATGELVKTFPTLADEDLEVAIASAHAAFAAWRRRPLAERANVLRTAAARLKEEAPRFAGLLTLEMGKIAGGALAEVSLSAGILNYYADNAEAFLAPADVPGAPGAKLLSLPLGVLLAVEPWNFPYYQVARVVGPQLVVGNVVMLKHAENVPQCALAFAELMEAAGAPPGVFTNIFASHEQIGRLIEDPRIVGVTVTGSERAGAAIAERAGRNLKKTVMELGGSDPFIVLPDAPLDGAVDAALFGRMFNTGQSCISAKRIIVVGQERGRAFLDLFASKVKVMEPGDPREMTTRLGPLSSQRALEGLLAQIEAARSGGATVLVGGARYDRPGYYLQPTILTDIAPSNPVYKQELFGPVASFFVVDDEDAAVALANDTPYGLGASIFTDDLENGRRLAERIDSGMVFVNQAGWTAPHLPFGGVKNSGFGRELAELGIGEFVNRKLVNVVPSGSPPFGPVPPKAS